MEDGIIENVYRLQVMNTTEQSHSYRITVSGMDSLTQATTDVVTLGPTETLAHAIRLRAAHGAGKQGSNKIHITLQALDDPSLQVTEPAVFFVPR